MTQPGPDAPTPLLEPIEDPEPDRSVRRKVILTLVAIFTIGSFSMWIYILFIYDPGLLIDELPDKAFPTQAEAICAEAVAQVDALPGAETAADNLERAQVVAEANGYLTEMVAALRPIAPTEDPVSAEAVNEWLDDWETHLEDRNEYAERLVTDETARFTESTRAEKQISRAIDSYAQVNSMVSCETPGDVG
ncbi:MAG: hypothetical protein ACR2OH_05190 [Microthrixaceae bacterium]